MQEVIDRDGWATGNSIALMLEGNDQGISEVENAREFESFENIADPEDGGDGKNHPERVPNFVVYFSMPETATKVSSKIQKTGEHTDEGVTFDASSDDAEQENDEFDALYDDDLDAGWEGEAVDLNILTTGLRFRDISVPKGAKIDSAFIYVHSHEAKTAEDVAVLTIKAEATDNAVTFTEDALISDRPSTSNTIEWTIAEEWGLYTKHRTPNIAAVVQEVIDRDGWAKGNAIALMLEGNDQGISASSVNVTALSVASAFMVKTATSSAVLAS